MVNVGGRNIDGLKKPSHKMEAVTGGVKEILVLGNLIPSMLAWGNTAGKI